MKKIAYLIVIMMVQSIFLLSAQELSVDYLEGGLEIETSGSWHELYIGDAVPGDGRLRLSDNGYAELLVGDALVSLSRDGEYNVRDLVKGSTTLQSGNTSLKQKLTLNTGFDKWKQEATMGVRGAEAAVSTGTGMEDAYTYLEAGMESMGDGDYTEALVSFEEGWEFFEDYNCLFFAALCYEELGSKRDFVKSLQQVEPSDLDSEFAGNYALKMGELLIRSLEYNEALNVLDNLYGADLNREEEQLLQFLKGNAWLGSGRPENARSSFQKARDLLPSSELGIQAAEALSSL